MDVTRKKAVTMRDVASIAGVSHQTVSRVINNSPNVKSAVRDKVQKTIDSLGYVPNSAARRMGGSRSYLILAVNDRARTIDNWQVGRGNDWVDQMMFGAMMECEENGYRLLLELVDATPAVAPKQLGRALSAFRPDGVILTPPHSENQELADLLMANGIAFARIGSAAKRDGINVAMDDCAAARAATEHLIALGHCRIGFVSGSADYLASQSRLDGFRQAMRSAGLPIDEAWEQPGDFSFASGEVAAEKLLCLPHRPTAIIASNDEMAFAVLHRASQHGLAVPDALSVVSFDDTPGVRFSVPPLTAIRQPIAGMAARAARELIADGAKDLHGVSITLPFELVIRSSTRPAAC
jgi:LacI family transcriptional regulator